MVSKVERVNVRGRTKLTLYQEPFNHHTDYIERDEYGHIIGMWANYFDSEILPTEPDSPIPSTIIAKIVVSTPTIKIGGSYKNLTVKLINDFNEDITTKYSNSICDWTCNIDDDDWTDKVTWRKGTEFNQMKVKFPNDTSVIGKILSINCNITENNEVIKSETLQLELVD